MKSEIFTKELSYITNPQIKEFCKVALDNLPEYFYTVAASSTGKYHPSYALGDGGLVRHTKAAARFANHMLQTEQNQELFSADSRDYIITAIILHDGWKHGNEGSSFTTHEHPKVCADWIRNCKIFDNYLSSEGREIIADAVASHMGQWNTTKRSKVVLEKPRTGIQKFVHMCDYLASRKDIEVLFDTEEQKPMIIPDINEYQLPFGKYKGKTLIEISQIDKGYISWAKENMTREPVQTLLLQV